MTYRNESGHFQSAIDGRKLYYQSWVPRDARPDWNVVLHHGFGEHSSRYSHLLDAFEGSGISFYSYDARGHGRSEGKRGHSRGVAQMVADLETFMVFCRTEFGVQKPFLLGHSMGGLVAITFALKHCNQWEISGLLTSGAALSVNQTPVMKVKKVVGTLLREIKPDITLAAGLELKYISHDPQVVEAYKTDNLVHGEVSVDLALDMLDAGETAIRRASMLKIPLYMAHGDADGIIAPSGSQDFFHRASSGDKKLVLHPGLYHEIFNETPSERARVFQELKAWLLERMPAEKPDLVGAAAE